MSSNNVSDASDAIVSAIAQSIERSGLAVETVAAASGVPLETLQSYMAGRQSPYVSDLARLGGVLGVKPSEWFPVGVEN